MTTEALEYSNSNEPQPHTGKYATEPQQTAVAVAFAFDLDLAFGLALDLDLDLALDLGLDVDALCDLRARLDALIIKADEAGMSVTGDRVQCARGYLDELIKLATA